jgi:hypothetical protein
MSNIRAPDRKTTRAVIRAFAWNGLIEPPRPSAPAPEAEAEAVIQIMCKRCGRPFDYRRRSGIKPKYCLGCARYWKPKNRPLEHDHASD